MADAFVWERLSFFTARLYLLRFAEDSAGSSTKNLSEMGFLGKDAFSALFRNLEAQLNFQAIKRSMARFPQIEGGKSPLRDRNNVFA